MHTLPVNPLAEPALVPAKTIMTPLTLPNTDGPSCAATLSGSPTELGSAATAIGTPSEPATASGLTVTAAPGAT
ncbi:MAG TPA: hypothetical protein VHX59_18845 [Mycobacteriales bacterium]|nr:hypothetical protein [Mycobacteriales bacterium]